MAKECVCGLSNEKVVSSRQDFRKYYWHALLEQNTGQGHVYNFKSLKYNAISNEESSSEMASMLNFFTQIRNGKYSC